MKFRALLPLAVVVTSLAPASALSARQTVQESIDFSMAQMIREEGLERSHVAELVGYLTDVIGPRLTGSSGMKRANEWTADQFREWGLTNVKVEPWGEFGRGWDRVEYMGKIVTPFVQPLDAHPMAWSGSTNGTVRGPAVVLDISDTTDLARYRGQLRGAFVLVREAVDMEPEWAQTQAPRRFTLGHLFDSVPPPRRPRTIIHREREPLSRREFPAVMRFLEQEQVAAYLQPSSWQYSVLLVSGMPGGAGRRPDAGEPTPGLSVSHEQYGEIYRNVKRGVPVELEVRVTNRFLDDDLQAYNSLGDIGGTDLVDQVVMLGAHLDSWHSGTGATDNAAGSAVMMEAMRILRALGIRPRRTIRIALWSGEEQGLLGSRAWVRNHEDELDHISAYVNVDNGTGRIRGLYDQGNTAAAPIFEQILSPMRDLGVMTVRHQEVGGTDHLAFDRVGVPGFNFTQDPIEYSVRTHHSNIDTYDHLVIDDLKQAATVVAWTVYNLAMRDQMIPRKAPPVQ